MLPDSTITPSTWVPPAASVFRYPLYPLNEQLIVNSLPTERTAISHGNRSVPCCRSRMCHSSSSSGCMTSESTTATRLMPCCPVHYNMSRSEPPECACIQYLDPRSGYISTPSQPRPLTVFPHVHPHTSQAPTLAVQQVLQRRLYEL